MAESWPHVVYYLYGEGDSLLYVGVTCNWKRRRKDHERDKPWYRDVVRHEIERFPTYKLACDREHEQINALQPRHNRKTYHQGSYYDLAVDRVPVELDLSPEAERLIIAIGAKLGLKRRQVISMAIGTLAWDEGIR